MTNYLDTMADTIDAAADLLEKEGWTRYIPYDRLSGERCLLGALYSASSASSPRSIAAHIYSGQVIDLMSARLPLQMVPAYAVWTPGSSTARVAYWNDRLAKDEFEVIDLLRKTAKDLRNRRAKNLRSWLRALVNRSGAADAS